MGRALSQSATEQLGMRFAKALILNTDASPYELPALLRIRPWKEANASERQRIVTDIAEKARARLLAAGLSVEQVEKVTRKHINY